jgi:hypothetical protein
MNRSLRLPVIALAALVGLAGTALAQAPKKADVVGAWLGTAVVGDDGSQVDITVVIEKAEAGYSGKISDTTGMVPETPLRQVVFKDGKLSFEFDLAQGMDTTLIKIELALESETLKGAWYDPDGNSGAILLSLKK